MKTSNVLLGTVIVAALANVACGNHVCPLWGCYPAPSNSTPPTMQVAQGRNAVTAEAARSEGLLSTVVTFFKDIVGRIVPGGQTAGTVTADVASPLGRPTEAVKKKASRMGLRKSKRYMKSLGRA
jgi:hypothetical protein